MFDPTCLVTSLLVAHLSLSFLSSLTEECRIDDDDVDTMYDDVFFFRVVHPAINQSINR